MSSMNPILPVVLAAHDLLNRCAAYAPHGRDFRRLSSGDDRQDGQNWTGGFALCVVPWLLDMGAHDVVLSFLERLARAESTICPGRIPPLVIVDAKAVQAVQKADNRFLPPSLREGEIPNGPVLDAPREAVSPEIAFLFAAAAYRTHVHDHPASLVSINGSVDRVAERVLRESGWADGPNPLSLVDAVVLFRALRCLDGTNAWRVQDRYLAKHLPPSANRPGLDSFGIALSVLCDFDGGRVDLARLVGASDVDCLMKTVHPLPDAVGGACAMHPWILAQLIMAMAKKGHRDEAAYQLRALGEVLFRERFTLGIDADGSSIAIRGDLATAACFVRAVAAVYGKEA